MAALATAPSIASYDASAYDPSGAVRTSGGGSASGDPSQALLDAVQAELARRRQQREGTGDTGAIDTSMMFAPGAAASIASTTGMSDTSGVASPLFSSDSGVAGVPASAASIASLFPPFRRRSGGLAPGSLVPNPFDPAGVGGDSGAGASPGGGLDAALALGNPRGLGSIDLGGGLRGSIFGGLTFAPEGSPLGLRLSPTGSFGPTITTQQGPISDFALNTIVGNALKAVGIPASVNLIGLVAPAVAATLGPFGSVFGAFQMAVQIAEGIAHAAGTVSSSIAGVANAMNDPNFSNMSGGLSPTQTVAASVAAALSALAAGQTITSEQGNHLVMTGNVPPGGLFSNPDGTYSGAPTGTNNVTGQQNVPAGPATGIAPSNSTNFGQRSGGDDPGDPSGNPAGVPGQNDGGMGGVPSGAAPSGGGPSGPGGGPSGAGPGGAGPGVGGPSNGGEGGSPSSGGGGGGGGGGGSCSLMSFTVQRLQPRDAADTRRFMDEFYAKFMRQNPVEAQRLFAIYRQVARGIIRAAVKRHQEDAVARYVYAKLIRPFGNHLEDAEVAPAVQHMASVVRTLLERFHLPAPAGLLYRGQILGRSAAKFQRIAARKAS